MKNQKVMKSMRFNSKPIAKMIGMLLLSLLITPVSAVYVNHQGIGQVFVQPYYSVNNNLNTTVSISNTTEQTKAVKINIREGLNGYTVLSYNVYLNAFDAWSFVLVPGISTIDGFVGQTSLNHISYDHSCAPFLNKASEEFVPFELIDGPQDLSRAREGFIEIIDMGEVTGGFIAAGDHGISGVPENCSAFETAWESGGVWHEESGGDVSENLLPVTGGLVVEADIINVAEGVNYSIPVVALDNFFAEDQIAHVAPGDSSLSLDAAEPKATVFANDKAYQLTFESGIDAVSAVLMSNQLINTYVLDSFVAGKSETVLTQPTRRFYVDIPNDQISPPYVPLTSHRFSGCFDTDYSGVRIRQNIVDREAQVESVGDSSCYVPVEICGSVSVQQYLRPDQQMGDAGITGSENLTSIGTPYSPSTESGFTLLEFPDTSPLQGFDVVNNERVQILGLPILGVSLSQFTNYGAAEGLLAQYGSSHRVNSKSLILEAGEELSSNLAFASANTLVCAQAE